MFLYIFYDIKLGSHLECRSPRIIIKLLTPTEALTSFLKELLMQLLKKLVVMSVLLIPSFSALASYCFPGGFGHCIWGVDKKDPGAVYLINSESFLEFCDKNNIYCSALNNGYHSIMGRYFNDEVFFIASKGYGGPDLILESKEQAEQFAQNFKAISKNPDALFFVKNDAHPTRSILAIGYKEKSSGKGEKIKLFILPNEWEETGERYTYEPPDE